MIYQSLKSLPVDVFFKFALIVFSVFGIKLFFRFLKLAVSILYPRGGLKRNFRK